MKRICLAIIVFSLFAACGSKPETLSVTAHARHLLNQGRYDAAISLLTNNENPITDEQRVLLASSYAGSVGLNLNDSYLAFEDILFKRSLAEEKNALLVSAKLLAEVPPQSKEEQEIASLIQGLSTGSKVIFGLQWIPPQKRSRILLASRELQLIPPHSIQYTTSRAYRYLLFVALYASSLRDSLPSPQKILNDPIDFLCNVNISQWIEAQFRMELNLRLIELAAKDFSGFEQNTPKFIRKLNSGFYKLKNLFTRNEEVVFLLEKIQPYLQENYCKKVDFSNLP